MTKDKHNIISTFRPAVLIAGPAWGSVLGFIRSLGRHKIPVYVIAPAPSFKFYAASKYCTAAFELKGPNVSEGFLDWLKRWQEEQTFNCKPIYFPVTDSACTYFSECKEDLNRFDLCIPAKGIILNMIDKSRANRCATENGLDVPPFKYVKDLNSFNTAMSSIPYPCIVKPVWWKNRGEVGFKTRICSNFKELEATGYELLNKNSFFLVQQYIKGSDSDVYTYMFYRTRDGKNIYGCTGRKIRQMPPNQGIMASGMAEDNPRLKEISDNFIRKIDYRGFGGIEFKKQGEKYCFIEMSVRPEGFSPLATEAGIDLSWIGYCDMVGISPGNLSNLKQNKAYWLAGLEYIHLIKYSKKPFKYLLEAIFLSMQRHVRFSVWSTSDPMPWFKVLLYTFFKKIGITNR